MATLTERFSFDSVFIDKTGTVVVKKVREIVKDNTTVIYSVPHRETYENLDLIDFDTEIPSAIKADVKKIANSLKSLKPTKDEPIA